MRKVFSLATSTWQMPKWNFKSQYYTQKDIAVWWSSESLLMGDAWVLDLGDGILILIAFLLSLEPFLEYCFQGIFFFD